MLLVISVQQYAAIVNDQKTGDSKGPTLITGPIPLPVGNPGISGPRGPEGITGSPVRQFSVTRA